MKVTEKLCKQLEPKWAKFGRVYQTWHQEKYRIEHFQKHIAPLFKGMKVLDIGCNAGLQALALDGIVEKYVGIEPNSDFACQFDQTQKLIKGDAVCLSSLEDAYRYGSDSVLASYVLYHLSDNELKDLAERILPDCKLAVVYTRTKTRENRKNSYDLFEPKNVLAYLEGAGFTSFKFQAIKNGSIHVTVATR